MPSGAAPLRFDLQSHSVYSDGELAPAEVVARAAASGIELLALTDHDTVEGVEEALAAGAEHGVAIVPAVELSAVHGEHEDLHVLGYGVALADAEWLARLGDARADREARAERMAARLEELGFAVDDTALAARRRAGRPIGRPHLAAAVTEHPENARRLAEEQVGEVSSFIPAYLVPGAAAYLPRTRPTVAEAIGWIHAAGGVAVWAHPFWDLAAPEEVLATLDDFMGDGLDGVEAFYATHTAAQTELLADRAEELALLSTGSSDFHGPEHRLFSRFGAHELHGRRPRLGPIGRVGGVH